MKTYLYKRTVTAAVLILMVGAMGAESAEQRFKFGDLFKKSKSASSANSTQTAAESAEKANAGETSKKLAANESASSTKKATSSSKELLNSDQLKSLSNQLDKVGSDPDALLRTARERFRQMKEKESSTKKKASVVKAAAKVEKKAETQSTSTTASQSSSAAEPIKVSEKMVTSGAVPPSSRVIDPSRPPSLAPVTAVAAVPVTTSREIPPENLRTDLAINDVPLPKPLVAKKEKKKKAEPSAMEITSDEVEMDNEKHTTTFIGNVNLEHPTFHLKSDRLVIYMHEEGVKSEAPFRTAVATGARVIVERTNDKGDKDVGQSRKVVYDALTGDLELSGGPPQLQSGGNLVKTSSQEATIILKKDGNHSVNGNSSKSGNPAGRTKIIIPMAGKKAGKGPNLMPSTLGDISKRK